jgi:hypothetical protein
MESSLSFYRFLQTGSPTGLFNSLAYNIYLKGLTFWFYLLEGSINELICFNTFKINIVEKMLEFYKSDLAKTITWVVGILALLWRVYAFYKSKAKTEVTLFAERLKPLFTEELKAFKNLEVKLFNHFVQSGKEIFTTNLYIKNTGNHDIDKDDIYEPMKITLNDDIIVLDYQLNNHPTNINTIINVLYNCG